MQELLFVKENEETSNYPNNQTTNYTHHDQLFKELIQTFFEEFIEIFFPDIYVHIDFLTIHPLSEEMFTDLFEGESRRADIVIETKLKGQETFLIIHVEAQSYYQENFHERMYHYFSLLYNKYRKPILPIAVFSYDEKRVEKNEYTLEFPFFRVMNFRYLTLNLRKLHWKDYITSDNPVAASLLSKMGYRDEEKIEVKKEFLRMLVRMNLDPARERYIYGFFEQYLTLSNEEEEILMQEVKRLDPSERVKIMELPISYEERGIEKGKEIGKEIGKEEATHKIAKELLKKGLPLELIEEVTGLNTKELEQIKDLP
ncbi:transposase [Ureibacillus massiliensis]|nr:transposase [Ureibacillus massiliensis]